MKILYFHQYFTPPTGSFGSRSYEFAKRLIARGHRVVMVCGRHDRSGVTLAGDPNAMIRRGVIDGIELIELNVGYSNSFGFVRRTLAFLKFVVLGIYVALREDYDLVFATSTPLTISIPAMFGKYLRSRPFVFEVRDLWPDLPKAMGVITNPVVIGAISALEWISYRCSDACIGLSPGMVEGIRRRSSKNLPIAMIPNASDLEVFRPLPREALDLPGVRPTDFVAVFPGAHGMANGLDSVLDAAAELKRRGRSDIVFAFIGDGKEKQRLIARAKSEMLDSCRFFDPMPKVKLNSVVGAADLGLMVLKDVPAFYYGTSPNKFFDFIAAGLPVVNNYPGWLASMIRENDLGEVVPPGDAVAFADAVERLASASPERRAACRLHSRALAERDFDRVRLADEFVDFLESVKKGGA